MEDAGPDPDAGGTFRLLQPDYVDAQATHKPQKSKKHFQLGSLSASTAENDNPIAPSAIASVAQNNPPPTKVVRGSTEYRRLSSCRPVLIILLAGADAAVRRQAWGVPEFHIHNPHIRTPPQRGASEKGEKGKRTDQSVL